MQTRKASQTTRGNKRTDRSVTAITSKYKLREKRTGSLSLLKKKNQRNLRHKTQNHKSREDIAKARRAKKLEQRKREKKALTAQDWAAPAPSNLVAKPDIPKVKNKYQSYFEFAENPEKKEKKLEFQVTNNVNPPAGYTFVSIGDPALTNACKELSRENGVMIFIVSTCKEDHSKITEQVHRIGFHFKQLVLQEAIEFLGERRHHISESNGYIEPIPELQEDINRQADAAIRDLFPKIPNTDRQVVIEHAFKKGAMYQGEPTVGTQSNIPLSRRVQLAVLAHIRHNHTRYDKLLRETSWMNARKAVEPLCLDIILKWRGNEENGRDQMDEILREVVIITDSESGDDDDQCSPRNDSSDDEVIFVSSRLSEPSCRPKLRRRPQSRVTGLLGAATESSPGITSSQVLSSGSNKDPIPNLRDSRARQARRGFKRYQAAWEEALHRQREPPRPTFCGLVPGYISSTPKYLESMTSCNRFRAPKRGTFDPISRFYCNNLEGYHKESRQGRDKNHLMTSPYAYSIRHDTKLGSLPHMDEITGSTRSERPGYRHDSSYQANANEHFAKRQKSPLVTARHGLEDVLVESIETASNEMIKSRVEEQFSDRFNYTSKSRTWQSDGHRYHGVESIKAASGEIIPSRVKEQVSDRFNYTPTSLYRHFGSLCHHDSALDSTCDQVVIIDDDSSPASSRHKLRYQLPGRLKKNPSIDQNIITTSQNSETQSTVFSTRSRGLNPSYPEDSIKLSQNSSRNTRSTYIGHLPITKLQTNTGNGVIHFPPCTSQYKSSEARIVAKSHVQHIDITLLEPTHTAEIFAHRSADGHSHGKLHSVSAYEKNVSLKDVNRRTMLPFHAPFGVSITKNASSRQGADNNFKYKNNISSSSILELRKTDDPGCISKSSIHSYVTRR